ncbi:MAG: hypothetical protein JW767_01515 [Thermoleophilia bacterium]|nr:hypothetical protein [Thermoleophilia bacterium]
MSVTVAHSPHIHLPYKSIAFFLAAAAVAAAVLVLVSQSRESQHASQTTSIATGKAEAVAMPKPESWSLLRAHPELAVAAGETTTGATTTTDVEPRHNLAISTTLDGEAAYISQPPTPWYAPGEVENAHPMNFIAGSTR